MAAEKVLLSVLAHPDDESFGMGGTLAHYARHGVKVYLICATRGEVGDVDAEHLKGFSSIAELRETELRCAAGKLGLSGVFFLDYRDSGMPGSADNSHPRALAAAPLDEVAACVATLIRRLQAQVVLTFDPIGGYKHPDHIAIHNATVKAFQLASDPALQDGQPPYQPQKLYFHVMPRTMFRWAVRLLPLFGRDPHHFGKNGDIDLIDLTNEGDFPVHAEVDFKDVQQIKEEAAACHASQLSSGPPSNGIVSLLMRWFGRREMYMRSYPAPVNGQREQDLFAGVG